MADTPRVAALTADLHHGKTATQILAESWERPYRDLACELEREADRLRTYSMRQRKALEKCEEALTFAYGGEPLPSLEKEALDLARAALSENPAQAERGSYAELPSPSGGAQK